MKANKYKLKISPKYPLVWGKEDFSIKIFCSIPNVATGILLTAKSHYYIIDPGDGILRDLNKEIGTKKLLNITDIFISHGHHDHLGGLWSLLTYLFVMKKSTPVNIYFPKNCIEIYSIHHAFNEVYAKNLTYKINLIEIDSEKEFKKDSLTIKPFKVNHREPNPIDKGSIKVPSLGYKFFYNEQSICYGGDSAYSENLLKMTKGSSLAILEAGAGDKKSDIHMTFEEAISIGKTADDYFLVHIKK